jgi:magnesium transporter
MLTLHTRGHPAPDRKAEPRVVHMPGDASDVDDHIVWVDLLNPTREEELKLEDKLGVLLPTREDMAEIETSSRLYMEDGAAFMTAVISFFGGQHRLQTGPVTFVLVKGRLITIRYIEPASFAIFTDHIEKQPQQCVCGATTFLNLLDVLIDRTADLIEKTETGIDTLSKSIFRRKRETKLEDALIQIGDYQSDVSRIRDSLVSLARLIAFAKGLDSDTTGLKGEGAGEYRERLISLGQDVASLSDHASYITGNMSFLLDAALGLISVEQNNVMKVISIVSVIFLPLTLIASVYGMNFVDMPFLHDADAFYWTCGLMVAIAAGLMAWLKSQRWI